MKTSKTVRKEKFRVTVHQMAGNCFWAMLSRPRRDGTWREVYRTARPDAQRAHDAVIAGAGYVDNHGRYFRKTGLSTVEGIEVQS